MTETDKIREEVLPYCNGIGIDIGCGGCKVKASAIGIDTRDCGDNLILDAFFLEDIFKNESFDYVYSSHFLEHVQDWQKLFLIMEKLLKIGGHLILYLPDKDLYTENNPEHLHFFDCGFFIDYIKDNFKNLEIVKSETRDQNDEYSFLIIARKICL